MPKNTDAPTQAQPAKLMYSRTRDEFVTTLEASGPRVILTSPPYTVCMELGTYCNLACVVCISNSDPSGTRSTTWVPDALESFRLAFGPLRIVWSGGEPTLFPQLEECILKSANLGNANILVTNASSFASGLPVDWVDISFYGANQESYRRYTAHGKFAIFVRNVKKYAADYSQVSASFTLGVHSTIELKSMVNLAIDSGIRRLKFHRLSLSGRLPSIVHPDSTADQIEQLRDFVSPFDVNATFTRTLSSEQKRVGYWVAKPPGFLTNSAKSIAVSDVPALTEGIRDFGTQNASLYTS